jgi:hypothetical protein
LAALLACQKENHEYYQQGAGSRANYAKNNNPLRVYVRSAEEPERFRAAS